MKHIVSLSGFLLVGVSVLAQSTIDGPTHDGQMLTVDLPADQHMKNIGSRVDGAGMCVMSSIEMAALAQGLDELRGLRNWCAQEPGGGYPHKVERQLAKFFSTKGVKPIPYMQYEGRNPEELMEIIDRTGRMACITYGYGPRYGRASIAHMVCSAMYRGKYGVVLDNNFPGEQAYEWMPKDELIKRMKHGSGSAWIFAWLTPSAPPTPKNKGSK